MCGSCNEVLVAYNSGALAYLQRIAPMKSMMLTGFGLLNLAEMMYSAMGGVSTVIWIGLFAGNIFYLSKVVEGFKHG